MAMTFSHLPTKVYSDRISLECAGLMHLCARQLLAIFACQRDRIWQSRSANYCSQPFHMAKLSAAARGTLGDQTAADMAALEQARRAAASSHATSAQDAAAATTAQQALAAADLANQLPDSNQQSAPTVFISTGQSSKKYPPKQQQQVMTGCRVASTDHAKQACAVLPAQPTAKKKSNQSRKQLSGPQESPVQAANDLAGKFVGFQS